jgi:hypothetical protein
MCERGGGGGARAQYTRTHTHTYTPTGVTYERDALIEWQRVNGTSSSPCVSQGPGAAAGGLPENAAVLSKIASWYRSRSWEIDGQMVAVHDQDVLGKV